MPGVLRNPEPSVDVLIKRNFIRGKGILLAWRLMLVNLENAVNAGMQPHDKYGHPIQRVDSYEQLRPDWEPSPFYPPGPFPRAFKHEDFEKCWFKLEQVLDHFPIDELPPDDRVTVLEHLPGIQAEPVSKPGDNMPQEESTQKQTQQVTQPAPTDSTALPFPCPEATWEQVTLVLKSDDLVYVKTPKGNSRVRFDVLGFRDGRKGDKPNKTTWPLFQVLARLGGEITATRENYIRDLPDRASKLNKHMRGVFGINDSIYVDSHYKAKKRYKTRFSISDKRESETDH
jgi:hypothetical protein